MKLDKWIKFQKNYCIKDTDKYVEHVDSVFVQICGIICLISRSRNICHNDFELDSFEVDSDNNVEYAPNYDLTVQPVMSVNEIFMNLGMLLYSLLYDAPYSVNSAELKKNQKLKSAIVALDLDVEYQRFDNLLEFLTTFEPESDRDWTDFPMSISKIEYVEKESSKILDTAVVLLEEFDEKFCVPSDILCNGKVYRINNNQKKVIDYSFLHKTYQIFYSEIGDESIYKNFNGEWGVITEEKCGRREFTPFSQFDNKLRIELNIVPKAFLPYITISLVRRKENCLETNIDNNPNLFANYAEVLIYSKYNLKKLKFLYISCDIPALNIKKINLKIELFYDDDIFEKIENTISLL